VKCNAEAYQRVDAARKLLLAGGFISERENTKVLQRFKRWIRGAGFKPDELRKVVPDERQQKTA